MLAYKTFQLAHTATEFGHLFKGSVRSPNVATLGNMLAYKTFQLAHTATKFGHLFKGSVRSPNVAT